MEEQDLYYRVRERVKSIKSFYDHLLIYAIIISGLTIVNFIDSPDDLWFYIPLVIWGIIIILHAVRVFGKGKFLGDEWVEKKTIKLMKEKNKEN